jgi:hypothetical protein
MSKRETLIILYVPYFVSMSKREELIMFYIPSSWSRLDSLLFSKDIKFVVFGTSRFHGMSISEKGNSIKSTKHSFSSLWNKYGN